MNQSLPKAIQRVTPSEHTDRARLQPADNSLRNPYSAGRKNTPAAACRRQRGAPLCHPTRISAPPACFSVYRVRSLLRFCANVRWLIAPRLIKTAPTEADGRSTVDSNGGMDSSLSASCVSPAAADARTQPAANACWPLQVHSSKSLKDSSTSKVRRGLVRVRVVRAFRPICRRPPARSRAPSRTASLRASALKDRS